MELDRSIEAALHTHSLHRLPIPQWIHEEQAGVAAEVVVAAVGGAQHVQPPRVVAVRALAGHAQPPASSCRSPVMGSPDSQTTRCSIGDKLARAAVSKLERPDQDHGAAVESSAPTSCIARMQGPCAGGAKGEGAVVETNEGTGAAGLGWPR